jgi:hypothetical protein
MLPDFNDPNAFVLSGNLRTQLIAAHSAVAFFAPRGVGATAFSGDDRRLTKIRRRFMLLGETLDGMRVWDIRRAVQAIQSVCKSPVKIGVEAGGSTAVNTLYAALFEPTVTKLDLYDLPQSQQLTGPDYLGVLKVTDLPQVEEAVATKTELTIGKQNQR